MPNFTDNRVDRAHESFDAVDVHFACRLNEIGCPDSTGTRRKRRSSSGTWREISGREEKEVGSENKLKGALVMSRDDFWDLIAQAKEACGQDEDEFVQWVKEQLVELGPHYAQDFHDILHAYSDFADQYGLWSAAGMIGQSSDDKFIDFRSWLIAQGRETYFKVLKNPDSLADIEPGDGSWFESFTLLPLGS